MQKFFVIAHWTKLLNSHKMVKLMSMETGSRTPLSAAHWYTPAWWRSTRSNINVELSERCVDPEKISCKRKRQRKSSFVLLLPLKSKNGLTFESSISALFWKLFYVVGVVRVVWADWKTNKAVNFNVSRRKRRKEGEDIGKLIMLWGFWAYNKWINLNWRVDTFCVVQVANYKWPSHLFFR